MILVRILTKVRIFWPNGSYEQYTPDSALALIVSAKLTKSAYQDIKEGADVLGHNIYPSYHKIREAKKKCFPSSEFINVTDSVAEVDFTALIHQTYK